MAIQFNALTGSRGIEWCDETRNATGGCMHDCKWQMPDGSVACCYAKELAERGVASAAYSHGFEHHYWRPNTVRELARGKDPKLIFVDSMSDMFAANVPAEHVVTILQTIRAAPHHAYQSLTKAAPMLLKYLDHLPPNLWVGVSSPPDWFKGHRLNEHQQRTMLTRSLEILRQVKESTHNIVWMSAEPISWDLTSVIDEHHPLDWIVIGAASHGRKYFQPNPDNVRRLLTIMDATRTPVFYKGNVRPLFQTHDLGSPDLNRWREDFPTAYRTGSSIPAVESRQRICEARGWSHGRTLLPPVTNQTPKKEIS
jgi:protein gp37